MYPPPPIGVLPQYGEGQPVVFWDPTAEPYLVIWIHPPVGRQVHRRHSMRGFADRDSALNAAKARFDRNTTTEVWVTYYGPDSRIRGTSTYKSVMIARRRYGQPLRLLKLRSSANSA